MATGIKVVNQVILRWGVILYYPSGPNVMTRVLKKWKKKPEEEIGEMGCGKESTAVAGFEERRSHKPKNTGSL